jgi:hypothetical protein
VPSFPVTPHPARATASPVPPSQASARRRLSRVGRSWDNPRSCSCSSSSAISASMDVLVLGRLEATDRTWTPTERPVEVAWEPARPLNGVAGPGAGGSSIRSTHQAGTSSRVRTADAGFDAARQAHMTHTPRSGAWGRPRTASSAHLQPLRGRYAHRYGTSPHRRRSKASPGRGGEALPGRRGGRRRPAPGAVPGEYAASYTVGDNYSGHVVGSGPYTRPPTSPDGWRCSTQPRLGCRLRPAAQGLGRQDPGHAGCP